MLRAFLRTKTHRAAVTRVIGCEGSLLEHFTPRIVLMGEGNRIAEVK